jgi:hypothetical protein
MSILDLPEELFFIDSIEMEGCVFSGKEKELSKISKQIWEGSHSIFSFIFGNKQCLGIKDIINEWMEVGTQTIIFYTPKQTLQEIRQQLITPIGTQLIATEIENFITSKIHNNVKNMTVYSLNNERDSIKLSSLFEIESLKKELERTNISQTHQLYMIGLPFKPYGDDIDFYLNGKPIGYEGGTLLGSSKIFAQRIKKGTILVTSDDGISLNFFDTNNYESNNENINYDLKSLDFKQDRLNFELDKKRPTLIESKSNDQLHFSRLANYQRVKQQEESFSSSKSIKKESGAIGVNLESFYIPFNKALEILHLLLINKDGQKILMGGAYHQQLHCDVVAEITIHNRENSAIEITNHSNHTLIFEKYDNNLWRLEEDPSQESRGRSINMYTNILNDNSAIENFSLGKNESLGNKLTIQPQKTIQLPTEELEFNDSNLYRDAKGVWIRYSQFELKRFNTTLQLNRDLYSVTSNGAILDCFVKYDSFNKSFVYGAKVQKEFTDILSRAISSKPINLTHSPEGLKVENQLDANFYIVQVLTSSQKYILEKEQKNILIKESDLHHLKIDIINKKYLSRPLIRFGLTFQG